MASYDHLKKHLDKRVLIHGHDDIFELMYLQKDQLGREALLGYKEGDWKEYFFQPEQIKKVLGKIKKSEPTRAGTHANWNWTPSQKDRTAIRDGNKKINEVNHKRAIKQGYAEMADKKPTTKKTKKTKAKKTESVFDEVDTAGEVDKAGEVKAPTKKSTKKSTTKKEKPVKAESKTDDLIPLKKICPEGMDLRVARRKLRKANLSFRSADDAKARWEFTDKQADEVIEILTEA